MVPVKEWWPRTRDFFREVWVEMKKVSWPGRTEVVGTTVVVIVACFLFGFYLFLVDSALSWVVDKIFHAAGVVS
jgi:preprotein translocase subunit SecE